MKINVLVTSGGGFQGLAIVKELSCLHFVNILLADTYEENVTKYFTHKAVTVLPISDPNFVRSLLKICQEENIHLVIPSTNHELAVLSEASELFSGMGICVAISSLP